MTTDSHWSLEWVMHFKHANFELGKQAETVDMLFHVNHISTSEAWSSHASPTLWWDTGQSFKSQNTGKGPTPSVLGPQRGGQEQLCAGALDAASTALAAEHHGLHHLTKHTWSSRFTERRLPRKTDSALEADPFGCNGISLTFKKTSLHGWKSLAANPNW